MEESPTGAAAADADDAKDAGPETRPASGPAMPAAPPAVTPAPSRDALATLPYHVEVMRLLRREEPEAWAWASSAQARDEHAAQLRAQLLKDTYRLDADAHPQLHAHCARAAARLGVDAPVTLWQGTAGESNAALFYLPGEAHVVFYGALQDSLEGAELEAVLGHELAHFALCERDGGAWLTAERLLRMSVQDAHCDDSTRETARLFDLYTEAFADRGGAIACGALEPAVAALVKQRTGLARVSAESYLRQAAEICATLDGRSDAASHPEVFVRTHALRLWCDAHGPGADARAADAAEAWLRGALEGPLAIDALDLAGQERLATLTRRLIGQFLRPRALRSDALLACARQFFPDAAPADAPDDALHEAIAAAPGVHDYVAAVLLDLAVADRTLDDVPLAQALVLAAELDLPDAFERLATKALKMTKRQFAKARTDAAALLQRVAGVSHD